VATPRPVLVVAGRQRPHELTLLLLSAMLGGLYTFGTPAPQSLAAEMPSWIVHAWGIGLLLSGITGLAGCLLPWNVERGLLLELGGLLVGAGALLIIAAAIFSHAGWGGLFGGGFTAAWLTANLVRGWQIWRDLRTLRRVP
jgi:hypothetical protein